MTTKIFLDVVFLKSFVVEDQLHTNLQILILSIKYKKITKSKNITFGVPDTL